jgi:NDP-sugar pyrophosphorylase family protein
MTLPVVVLAGGLGSRLRGVTGGVLPKALVDVAGRPFIDRKLDQLEENGVSEVVVLVGHGAGPLVEHLARRREAGLRVTCAHDGSGLLGTGGAVRAARELLPSHFWVTYGDTLLEADMSDIERRWRESGLAAGMTLVHNCDVQQTSNASVVDERVVRYSKRDGPGRHEYLDYGLLILPRDAFEREPLPEVFDLGVVLEMLVDDRQLAAIVVDSWFYDVGTPEALAATTERYRSLDRRQQAPDRRGV